jgi:hypothetical protein
LIHPKVQNIAHHVPNTISQACNPPSGGESSDGQLLGASESCTPGSPSNFSMTVLSLEAAEEGRSAGGPWAAAILDSAADISRVERNYPGLKIFSMRFKAEYLFLTRENSPSMGEYVLIGSQGWGGLGHSRTAARGALNS